MTRPIDFEHPKKGAEELENIKYFGRKQSDDRSYSKGFELSEKQPKARRIDDQSGRSSKPFTLSNLPSAEELLTDEELALLRNRELLGKLSGTDFHQAARRLREPLSEGMELDLGQREREEERQAQLDELQAIADEGRQRRIIIAVARIQKIIDEERQRAAAGKFYTKEEPEYGACIIKKAPKFENLESLHPYPKLKPQDK